jgi:hypothetical protein
MANRNRDLARRDTGAAASGSGQVTRLAGLVTLARRGGVVHRVVPAHLACRIGARTRAGERNAWSASGTMKRRTARCRPSTSQRSTNTLKFAAAPRP